MNLERIRKAAATIYSWDCPLFDLCLPGFDCASCVDFLAVFALLCKPPPNPRQSPTAIRTPGGSVLGLIEGKQIGYPPTNMAPDRKMIFQVPSHICNVNGTKSSISGSVRELPCNRLGVRLTPD